MAALPPKPETVPSHQADLDSLYYADPYTWSKRQVEALRRQDYDAIDLEHIIEEIEDVGGRHEDRLLSHYTRILEHFLKLQYRHPGETEPVRGWENTIKQARTAAQTAIRRSRGLRHRKEHVLAEAWQDARAKTIDTLTRWETDKISDPSAARREDKRLTREWSLILPRDNPYTLHQVENSFWYPDSKVLSRRPIRRDSAYPDQDWTG